MFYRCAVFVQMHTAVYWMCVSHKLQSFPSSFALKKMELSESKGCLGNYFSHLCLLYECLVMCMDEKMEVLQLPHRCIIYLIVSRNTVRLVGYYSLKRLEESTFKSVNVCQCTSTIKYIKIEILTLRKCISE